MDKLTIKAIIEGYRDKKFTPREVFEHYYYQIEKHEQNLNSLNMIVDKETVLDQIKDTPAAIPVVHKDIFSTKGIETTASSNILEGYIPPYDATTVTRLKNKGFITIAKANCDAFAHGTTGENSDFGVTKNPYDLERVAGGSSSGSAAAVAGGLTPLSTATDTGGSIRLPASYTNTVGIKPTYGRVSRYGIIAMTSSTDTIGHISRTVWDNAYTLNVTAGYDPSDATTSHVAVPNYLANIENGVRGLKLGIPKEYIENLDPAVESIYTKAIAQLESLGAEIIEDVSLPHTEYALNAYYIITPSEVSSNLARFDGIRFGHDRSYFGNEAKRRILMGTYCLSSGYYDAYYIKAQKVRTLVIKDFKRAFTKVDALIAPVSPGVTPKIGELVNDPIRTYMLDVLTVPVNLSGNPSLAIPAGFSDGQPVGIQIIGDHFREELLYQIGYAFEQETRYFEKRPEITESK